jgi:hypothetical protein
MLMLSVAEIINALSEWSSELRRLAYASLRIVEVLTNLSNHEDEKNSSEFFEIDQLSEAR